MGVGANGGEGAGPTEEGDAVGGSRFRPAPGDARRRVIFWHLDHHPARMRLPVSPLVVALLLAGTSCARASQGGAGAADTAGASPASAGSGASAPVARPLATMAAQPVVVVPVQRLRADDATGWLAAAGPAPALLRALDDEITFAVRERGTASAWALPPDVVRTARRSPTLGIDPYVMPVDALLGRVPAELPPALIQPLRGIAALGGQRYVLVPAELRFARRADGQGVAVLHVALVDTRGARQVWAGDVHGDPASTFGRGLLTSLAEHFADLIAAP